MKGVTKILLIVIIFLLLVIGGLIWWFIFKPETKENNIDYSIIEKEALEYFNKYNDVYASRMMIDYYENNKKTTILEDEYKKATKKYNYYSSKYGEDMELFFDFLKNKDNIKDSNTMATMLMIWEDIVVREDDIIYFFDNKTRANIKKGYDLVQKMNGLKSQASFDDFKNYFWDDKLNNYEVYSIYMHMIDRAPNLLTSTKITYNNEKITFEKYLNDNYIYTRSFSAIDYFYEKFISEETE